MANEESRLITSQQDEIVTIKFIDRNILEEGCIQQIGDELSDIISRNDSPRILISFENVEHLSSAALGVLITVNNKIKQKKGQLRLSNIDPQILEVFVITNLNKLFDIYEDNDQAMQSLQRSAKFHNKHG